MKKITYTAATGESITFGCDGGALTLESIDANSVGTTVSTGKNAGQDGQTTTGITYNARDIRCRLGIKGKSGAKWSRSAYNTLWRQVTQILLPHRTGKLTYTNDSGTYEIECYPQEIADPEHKAGEYYTVTVDFIADYPFWRSAAEQQVSIPAGGSVSINNPAGIELPVTVVFTGAASNIKLENTNTGEFIRLAQSIGSGETLTVDTAKYTAVLSDGTKANYKLAANSVYLRLPHGTNALSVTSDGISPVLVKYKPVFLGV